jgi:very-short-patch-repair endonuclease
MGLKFRRQYRIYNYVVDFYCHDLKLAIELDGGVHRLREQADRDANRDAHLEYLGYRVLRFSNQEVESELGGVLSRVAEVASARPENPSPPAPLPEGEGRDVKES